MIILTENNAFQNISKCLNAKCDSEIQVYDFLQFCIEFIFYDKTKITGTVPLNVIDNTTNLINLLESKYSIDFIDIESIEEDSENGKYLINSIAKQVFTNIDEFFNKSKSLSEKDLWINFPELSEESKKLIINATNAVKENNKNIYLKKYYELSSFSRDSGYFKILNSNIKIIDKIFEFNEKEGWNISMTLNLLTRIRFLTNKSMAENKYIFMPSVKRGRDDFMYGKMPVETGEIEKENPIGFLELPSIKNHIIKKGKGKPHNIMESAVKLREKLIPIQKYIKKNKINIFNDTKILKEIENAIFDELNVSSQKLKVAGNIRTYDYEQVSVIDPDLLINNKSLETCIQAFNEITMDTSGNICEYEKDLINNCMKK